MVAMTLDMGWDIPVGTPVYTADDHKLGVVARADPHEIDIEDGFIFRRAYAIRHADVARYDDGVLYLRLTMDEVEGRVPSR